MNEKFYENLLNKLAEDNPNSGAWIESMKNEDNYKKLIDQAASGLRDQEDKIINEMMEKPEKHQVGIIFAMPYGSDIRIYSSKKIPFETDMNEEIEGVTYTIQWGDEKLPWCSKTQLQVTIMAMSAQWAAKEMLRRCRAK